LQKGKYLRAHDFSAQFSEKQIKKRSRNFLVKLCAAAPDYFLECFIEAQSMTVGAVGRHRVKGIDKGEYLDAFA
jgi:hypothetical protein